MAEVGKLTVDLGGDDKEVEAPMNAPALNSPTCVPPNFSFEIDDFDDEWIYPFPFSYIHGHLMAFCSRDPISVFRKAFNALELGGYFEMQEGCAPLRGVDDSVKGTHLLKACTLLGEACLKQGIDVTAASRYKALMEEIGFLDVKEIIFKWPFGPWAKGRYYKTIGAWVCKDYSQGIEGMAMGLFTRVLGMKPERAKELVDDVQRDLQDDKVHAY